MKGRWTPNQAHIIDITILEHLCNTPVKGCREGLHVPALVTAGPVPDPAVDVRLLGPGPLRAISSLFMWACHAHHSRPVIGLRATAT